MKLLAGILVVAVGALVWAMYSLNVTRRQMTAQQQTNEITILDFSNRLAVTRRQLDEQKQVNIVLETNLTDRAKALESLRTEISSLNADLTRSRAEAKSAQDEIAKRDTQITSLEGRNVDLTRQMGDLQTSIAGLERQITETERRLVTSEGNRAELMQELQRLQEEKIGLEKQLNDLAFLRDQVRKLKEELTVARRLEWIRRGIYAGSAGKKGAEVLNEMKFGGERASTTAGVPGKVPSLDVELTRSGNVTVRPGATNTAPVPR